MQLREEFGIARRDDLPAIQREGDGTEDRVAILHAFSQNEVLRLRAVGDGVGIHKAEGIPADLLVAGKDEPFLDSGARCNIATVLNLAHLAGDGFLFASGLNDELLQRLRPEDHKALHEYEQQQSHHHQDAKGEAHGTKPDLWLSELRVRLPRAGQGRVGKRRIWLFVLHGVGQTTLNFSRSRWRRSSAAVLRAKVRAKRTIAPKKSVR